MSTKLKMVFICIPLLCANGTLLLLTMTWFALKLLRICGFAASGN